MSKRAVAVVFCLFALLAGAPLPAEDKPLDLAGDWDVEMTREEAAPIRGTISLKQSEDYVWGTWQLQGAEETQRVEGEVRGKRVRLAWTIQGGNRELSIVFRGVVRDGEMTGTVLFGELGEADWKAVRKS